MKISYIPVVATATTSTIEKVEEMGWLQEIIHNAIQSAIVDPFTNWCTDVWINFMNASHYICLFTAIGGVIFWICGIEKGKKVAIVATLTYVGLRILNMFILG